MEWNDIIINPKNDQVIICCWPSGHMQFAKYMNDDYWFESTKGNHMVNKIGFTHWMPLPPLPNSIDERD